IYEAHYLQILKSINDVSANYDYLLVFGHNPGLSDLVAYTSNQYVELKTASIACLTIENGLDYSTLSANTATLNKVISS
ncbi:MAG: SixA phosphatase family protein, partial [Sphingobacterium sp.]